MKPESKVIFLGWDRVLEISSCSVDFADGADDGQRVQDDGRHSEVMIMITITSIAMHYGASSVVNWKLRNCPK